MPNRDITVRTEFTANDTEARRAMERLQRQQDRLRRNQMRVNRTFERSNAALATFRDRIVAITGTLFVFQQIAGVIRNFSENLRQLNRVSRDFALPLQETAAFAAGLREIGINAEESFVQLRNLQRGLTQGTIFRDTNISAEVRESFIGVRDPQTFFERYRQINNEQDASLVLNAVGISEIAGTLTRQFDRFERAVQRSQRLFERLNLNLDGGVNTALENITGAFGRLQDALLLTTADVIGGSIGDEGFNNSIDDLIVVSTRIWRAVLEVGTKIATVTAAVTKIPGALETLLLGLVGRLVTVAFLGLSGGIASVFTRQVNARLLPNLFNRPGLNVSNVADVGAPNFYQQRLYGRNASYFNALFNRADYRRAAQLNYERRVTGELTRIGAGREDATQHRLIRAINGLDARFNQLSRPQQFVASGAAVYGAYQGVNAATAAVGGVNDRWGEFVDNLSELIFFQANVSDEVREARAERNRLQVQSDIDRLTGGGVREDSTDRDEFLITFNKSFEVTARRFKALEQQAMELGEAISNLSERLANNFNNAIFDTIINLQNAGETIRDLWRNLLQDLIRGIYDITIGDTLKSTFQQLGRAIGGALVAPDTTTRPNNSLRPELRDNNLFRYYNERLGVNSQSSGAPVVNQGINVNAGVTPQQALVTAQAVGQQTKVAIERDLRYSGTRIRRGFRGVPA